MNQVNSLLLVGILSGATLVCSNAYGAPILSSAQLIDSQKKDAWQQQREWVLYQEGSVALQAKLLEHAQLAFEQSLQENPNFFPAFLGLADIEFQNDRPEQAKIHLQQALEIAPESSLANTAWAKYLYLSGQFADAEAGFKKAIELNSEFIEPKLELASLYLIRRNTPEPALTLYEQVIAMLPTYAPAYYGKISALIASQKLAAAEKAVAQAQIALGEDAKLYELLGTILTMSGSNDEAIKALEQAVALSPESFSATRSLADLYFGSNKLEQVVSLLTDIPFSLADSAELNYKLGLAYQLQGQLYRGKLAYEKP